MTLAVIAILVFFAVLIATGARNDRRFAERYPLSHEILREAERQREEKER